MEAAEQAREIVRLREIVDAAREDNRRMRAEMRQSLSTTAEDRQALKDALDAVTNATGIGSAHIMSRSRKPPVARARFMVWRHLRAKGMTLQSIADLFDCHHTTVMNGLRRIAK